MTATRPPGVPGPDPGTSRLVALGARALALVLELDPADLRADTPLDELGADSIARVCAADVLEDLAERELGLSVRLDDGDLAAARTLGDLVAPLARAGGAR
jgi:acyl carrier protein